MKVLALDVSKTKTGWAFWDTSCDVSSMTLGSFGADGDDNLKATEDFVTQLDEVIRSHKPELIAVEAPLANIKTYKSTKKDLAGTFTKIGVNATSTLILHRLIGAVQTIARAYRVPYTEVAVMTWRKVFLGYGKKDGMSRPDYKRAAKRQCELEKINCKNMDEAEAAGIALWAGRVSQIGKQTKGDLLVGAA